MPETQGLVGFSPCWIDYAIGVGILNDLGPGWPGKS